MHKPNSLYSTIVEMQDISYNRLMKETKVLVYICNAFTPARACTHTHTHRVALLLRLFSLGKEYPSKFEFITILGHILWRLECFLAAEAVLLHFAKQCSIHPICDIDHLVTTNLLHCHYERERAAQGHEREQHIFR